MLLIFCLGSATVFADSPAGHFSWGNIENPVNSPLDHTSSAFCRIVEQDYYNGELSGRQENNLTLGPDEILVNVYMAPWYIVEVYNSVSKRPVVNHPGYSSSYVKTTVNSIDTWTYSPWQVNNTQYISSSGANGNGATKIASSSTPIYNIDCVTIEQPASVDPPSSDDIKIYNFTGIKILSPIDGATIKPKTTQITVNGHFPFSGTWNILDDSIGIKEQREVLKQAHDSFGVNVNGIKFDTSGAFLNVTWVGFDASGGYDVQFRFDYPFTIKADTTIQCGVLAETNFASGLLFWSNPPTLQSFTTDSTYHVSASATDSSSDSAGSGTGAVSGAPQRSDSKYDGSILGTVSWGFDSLIYYITWPFTEISNLFTQLITTATSVLDWLPQMTGFLSSIFAFLPGPFTGLLIVAFTACVISLILGLFKR